MWTNPLVSLGGRGPPGELQPAINVRGIHHKPIRRGTQINSVLSIGSLGALWGLSLGSLVRFLRPLWYDFPRCGVCPQQPFQRCRFVCQQRAFQSELWLWTRASVQETVKSASSGSTSTCKKAPL